jgi:hypothetical protein
VADSKQVRPKLRREDLYGGGDNGGLLQGKYQTEKVFAWFQKHHQQSRTLIDDKGYYHRGDHSWRVSYGVRYALNHPLRHVQMAVQYPWFVTWQKPSPSEAETAVRYRKKFMSLVSAIDFVATKAQYVDPSAAVVSVHGYDIPPDLRGKLPSPWKWCPRCMTARKFRRVRPQQEFFAHVKVEKENSRTGRSEWVWVDRRLALMQCPVCRCTNRDPKFRRSNQPWTIRKFRQGARRAKRR